MSFNKPVTGTRKVIWSEIASDEQMNLRRSVPSIKKLHDYANENLSATFTGAGPVFKIVR